MRGTQVTLVVVVPQALTNGIEVVKPIIIDHAKGHSDVGQMLSRNQIMEYASNDNYDICVDSAHMDSLLPCLRACNTWTTILVAAFSWLQSLSDAVTATQDKTSWRSLVRDATRPATQAT